MRATRLGPLLVAAPILFLGCADQAAPDAAVEAKVAVPVSEAAPASEPSPASMAVEGGGAGGMMGMMGGMTRASGGDAIPPQAAEVPPDVSRKIIYSADIALSVEDFDQATDRVVALVEQYGGYLAKSDVYGAPGRNRRGTWTARVPVDRFEGFVEAVVALGELERRQTDSQDVTAEWYDLEARLKNKRVEEDRLVNHLKETTGELKEILDVERELSRVREEIERLEGRRRLLDNLTSLTTVTLTIQERTRYTPAQAPTFAQRVGRRFQGSTEQLVHFGQEVSLGLISVVPWLPVWLVVGLIVWLLVRAIRRRWPIRGSEV